MLHTTALVVKDVSQPDGVIEAVVGSSNAVDRMGEVIDQSGWVLDNYQKNPVILWGHNVREERPPIGKALKVWLQGAQARTKKLMFTVQFDLQDDFAAGIYRKVKDGFINTVSVGFMPLEREDNTFTKSELLELSFVPVPANPEALVQLRSAGLEPMELKEMFPAVKEEPVPDEKPKEEEKVDDSKEEDTEKPEDTEEAEETVDEKVEEESEKEEETESEESESEEETETEGEEEETESEEESDEEGKEDEDSEETEGEEKEEDEKPEEEAVGDEPKAMADADIKPYPNEHACRLVNPADFESGSFRSTKRKHDGKEYRVIMGKKKGETSMTEQSYRYGKDVWDKAAAKTHCGNHGGSFEPATSAVDDTEIETKGNSGTGMKKFLKDMKGHITNMQDTHGKMAKAVDSMKSTPVNDLKLHIGQMGSYIERVNGLHGTMMGDMVDIAGGKDIEAEEIKGVVPYKDLGQAPESDAWDAAGEMKTLWGDGKNQKKYASAHAWFDSSANDDDKDGYPDVKGAYKLPHHNSNMKAVWRGVAAAMAALLGARGGVDLPEADKKGVYNHLAKHYKEFKKEAPEYRMVEEQVLKGFEEEIHALVLDREDRHEVRLIKKVLELMKQEKKQQKRNPSEAELKAALQILDLALSKATKSSIEGGDK